MHSTHHNIFVVPVTSVTMLTREEILDNLSFGRMERPLTLGEQVYNTLRAQLVAGAIEPGCPMQELHLSERLGVSRTPVREAMARLASEGLLEMDRRSFVRSFAVRTLTHQDVDDIYEVRHLLEPAALRQVSTLTTDPGKRAAIDVALAAAVSAHSAGDVEGFRDAHACYRTAWLALVSNRRLQRVIEMYVDHMQQISTLTLGDARVRKIVLRGLTRLTAALAVGDGDAAAAEMGLHLQNAKSAFIKAARLDGLTGSKGTGKVA